MHSLEQPPAYGAQPAGDSPPPRYPPPPSYPPPPNYPPPPVQPHQAFVHAHRPSLVVVRTTSVPVLEERERDNNILWYIGITILFPFLIFVWIFKWLYDLF